MSFVYLIATEDRSACKVGKAKDVAARLALFQTGNAKRLEVIATAPGGLREEFAIHALLEDFELSGEWFSHVGECLADFWTLPGAKLTVGALSKPGLRPNIEDLARAIKLDPSLLLYLSHALDVAQVTRCSCSAFYKEIKPDLVRDVGFGRIYAEDGWLKTSAAYDAIYRAAWACLPPCRQEICGGAGW